MGQKVAGTCYVKADGAQFTIAGTVEAPITPYRRESIVPGFFKEEDLVPYINVEVLHTADLPIKALVNKTDMTVTAEFKNGKVYVLSGAYLVDEPASSSDEGRINLVFNGVKGSWQ